MRALPVLVGVALAHAAQGRRLPAHFVDVDEEGGGGGGGGGVLPNPRTPPPSPPGNAAPQLITVKGTRQWLFDGDVISYDRPAAAGRGAHEALNAGFSALQQKWPNGLISYFVWPEVPQDVRDALPNHLGHLEQETCLRFRECRSIADCVYGLGGTRKRNFVNIVSDQARCYSNVGMLMKRGGQGPKDQWINLGGDCATESIAHEVLHTAGFYHEHQRHDRDRFVFFDRSHDIEVDWDQNIGDKKGNAIGPYTQRSIMHYPGRQRLPDGSIHRYIIARNGGDLGARRGTGMTGDRLRILDDRDMAAIATVYGVAGWPRQPGGPTTMRTWGGASDVGHELMCDDAWRMLRVRYRNPAGGIHHDTMLYRNGPTTTYLARGKATAGGLEERTEWVPDHGDGIPNQGVSFNGHLQAGSYVLQHRAWSCNYDDTHNRAFTVTQAASDACNPYKQCVSRLRLVPTWPLCQKRGHNQYCTKFEVEAGSAKCARGVASVVWQPPRGGYADATPPFTFEYCGSGSENWRMKAKVVFKTGETVVKEYQGPGTRCGGGGGGLGGGVGGGGIAGLWR